MRVSPTIRSVLGTRPCDCGRCRPVLTERVTWTDDLAGAVAEVANGRRPVLLGDPRTLSACAETLLAESRGAKVVDLESTGAPLRADDEGLDRVLDALRGAGPERLAVAIGSGTVNDLVKGAAHALGIRYVAVATAPSMNGYTSAIAALTRDGLKRTVAADPPVAVLASPRVLAESPSRLSRSGLADLLSKPVSSADWRASHLLWGDAWCPVPAELAGVAVEAAVGAAGDLGTGGAGARVVLLDALVVSGLSMAIAGSSSPASGGEHLVSHVLDMTAPQAPGGPRTPALHGEQVGVATRIATRLWEDLLSHDAAAIDWEGAASRGIAASDLPGVLEREGWLREELRQRFSEQGCAKLERLGDGPTRVHRIRECWRDVVETVTPEIRAARRHRSVLALSGAPLTAAAIGVGEAEMRRVVRVARWMRDRYTVLDLADDLGLLETLLPRALEGVA